MVATSHEMKFVCPALYYPLFAAMSMTTDARVNPVHVLRVSPRAVTVLPALRTGPGTGPGKSPFAHHPD
jgi:hypothetical protein